MKLDDTVMVQFLGSLSNHTASRSWIRKRQGNFQRRKKVPGRLKKRTGAVKPTSVQDGDRTFGCMLDISQIKQEQLYIQGIKDGIRIRKLVKEIEEGEEC